MDKEEFYEEVGKVVLFPGSVEDLSKISLLDHESEGEYRVVQYDLMHLEGPQKYLTGIVIPTPDELLTFNQEAGSQLKVFGMLDFASNKEHREAMANVLGMVRQMEESPELLEKMAAEMFSSSKIMETDIRMKALKIGARGLVHFQKYDNGFPSTYVGVPVTAYAPFK